MLLLLFEIFEIPGYITLIVGTLSAISGFAVAYVYFKSGIESKKADGYKGLYELETERAKKYELLFIQEKDEHNITKGDYDSLADEYGQLSELFAKKSLILEAFTGQYGGVAKTIEHLATEGKLALPRKMLDANLHKKKERG